MRAILWWPIDSSHKRACNAENVSIPIYLLTKLKPVHESRFMAWYQWLKNKPIKRITISYCRKRLTFAIFARKVHTFIVHPRRLSTKYILKVRNGYYFPLSFSFCKVRTTWWRYEMETFSVLLALCAGNSPVTGEFPSQRPMTRSFDVFFDLRLNKRWVNNREAGDLRRHRAHCNEDSPTACCIIPVMTYNWWSYWWLSARLQNLQCVSNADAAALHQAIDMSLQRTTLLYGAL